MNPPQAIVQHKSPVSALAAICDYADVNLFAATVRATVFPNGQATNEQLMAFCTVAKEYGLNPFTKQVFAFPNKGGGITPMISVDGWASIMNQNPNFHSIDFDPLINAQGDCYAMRCTIKRKDRGPTSIVEFLDECKGNSGPWIKSPLRMLRHRAMIQCARLAFSLSGIVDEQDGQTIIDAEVSNTTPEPSSLKTLTEKYAPKTGKQPDAPVVREVEATVHEPLVIDNAAEDAKIEAEARAREAKEADEVFSRPKGKASQRNLTDPG